MRDPSYAGKRARAAELRVQGCTVPDIADQLGVARSTAYLWTRHVPLDREAAAERRRRQLDRMREARWAPHREARDATRADVVRSAAEWVGALSDRGVRLLGAVAYWCEGAKEKPWRRNNGYVQFINSDVRLILLLLRFLAGEGVERQELTYRLSIHESADVAAATRFRAGAVGVPAASFRRPTLKRHEPRTSRRNVGEAYRGCLIVYAPKSSAIYWRIEGVMSGVAREMGVDESR